MTALGALLRIMRELSMDYLLCIQLKPKVELLLTIVGTVNIHKQNKLVKAQHYLTSPGWHACLYHG